MEGEGKALCVVAAKNTSYLNLSEHHSEHFIFTDESIEDKNRNDRQAYIYIYKRFFVGCSKLNLGFFVGCSFYFNSFTVTLNKWKAIERFEHGARKCEL